MVQGVCVRVCVMVVGVVVVVVQVVVVGVNPIALFDAWVRANAIVQKHRLDLWMAFVFDNEAAMTLVKCERHIQGDRCFNDYDKLATRRNRGNCLI